MFITLLNLQEVVVVQVHLIIHTSLCKAQMNQQKQLHNKLLQQVHKMVLILKYLDNHYLQEQVMEDKNIIL